MVTVRRGTADDIPQLAGLLARAFYDNPIERWLLPDDDRPMAALAKFQTMRLHVFDLPIGEVWTTADLSACAKWVPPGGPSRQGDLARVHPTALLPIVSLLPLLGRGLPR